MLTTLWAAAGKNKTMKLKPIVRRCLTTSFAVLAIALCCGTNLQAQKAAELDKKVDEATAKLFASSDAAKNLSKVAKGILVFPSVKKAGFMVGGQQAQGWARVFTWGPHDCSPARYWPSREQEVW